MGYYAIHSCPMAQNQGNTIWTCCRRRLGLRSANANSKVRESMHSVLQQIPSLSNQWLNQTARWVMREFRQIRNAMTHAQARNGNAAAQYRLALLYENGEMHAPTPHTALQLLRQAAYSGVGAAQLQLAFK